MSGPETAPRRESDLPSVFQVCPGCEFDGKVNAIGNGETEAGMKWHIFKCPSCGHRWSKNGTWR